MMLSRVCIKVDNCGNIILKRNRETCFLQEGFYNTREFIQRLSKRAFNRIDSGWEVNIRMDSEYLDSLNWSDSK